MKINNWWADAMRFSVFQLGLTPDEFWRLSAREFEVLTLAHSSLPAMAHAPDRQTLNAMLQRYPDRTESEKK